MIPSLALVRVETPGWRGFPIWLPLFLLWVPAIVLAPLILPLVVVVCLMGKVNPWRAIAALWSIVCSLPGTNVRVCGEGKRIHVRIL
jgi:hypothetical protein